MVGKVIKEIIIMLLIFIVIVLLLGIIFYEYIPINKIVPEKVKYEVPDEVQKELDTIIETKSEEVIVTYNIDGTELDIYQKSKNYNPGKSDPFSAYVEPTTQTNSINTIGNSVGEENVVTQNKVSSGNIFDKGTTK